MPRRQVVSWALWDWATQPLNTVIITFVFTALYLVSDAFLDPVVAALGEGDPVYDRALAGLASDLGIGLAVAGVLIALIAPVLGQRADVTGRRKAWLGLGTAVVVLCLFGLFFVEADPRFFWLGVVLIAVASIFEEIAGVNYNALLVSVSTPRTIGKVSGVGWGMGYLGGIIALTLIVIATQADWWGMPTDNGMAFRVIGLGCAIWAIAFAWPLFVFVPNPPANNAQKVGLLESYRVLFRHVAELWRTSRSVVWFLLASAVFRDGLAGIFTFGALIAATSFGFSATGVMLFGIAANLIAGVATMIAGWFDDRFGPRAVIVVSLTGIVIAGLAVVLLRDLGQIVFWIGGLALSSLVGPAQAASRSFLGRVAPAGREAEVFGLYATTGRAVSFLAPGMFALAVAVTGATIWGTLGVLLVVLAGLLMMLLVEDPQRAPHH